MTPLIPVADPGFRRGANTGEGKEVRETYYFQKFFAENPLVRTDFNKFVDEYECEK